MAQHRQLSLCNKEQARKYFGVKGDKKLFAEIPRCSWIFLNQQGRNS